MLKVFENRVLGGKFGGREEETGKNPLRNKPHDLCHLSKVKGIKNDYGIDRPCSTHE